MLLAAASAAVLVAACGSSGGGSTSSSSSGTSGLTPPQAKTPVPASVGAGEGKLNLIAWAGYAQPQWVKPFEKATGCQVSAKYGNTSSEMVSLMANGGGGQYDMVSASGDADLRLIYSGDVKPININLVPQWKNFHPFLQNPPFNTIGGKHYGVSYEFGPNVLLYSKKAFPSAPTSWSVLYNKKYAGEVTVPNNPIQIADAAFYLMHSQPDLGIKDPYELNKKQFDATIALLKQQRKLVKLYWNYDTDGRSAFANGDVSLGAIWPVDTLALQAKKVPVKEVIPSDGATGWADTWMLAKKAPHPNCAYLWMKYVTTPKVEAQQALIFGETPVNPKACPFMDDIQAGSCAKYHLNEPLDYYNTIKFWKTPIADCGNGKNDCMDYNDWQTAWTQITG
jgi:putative spermidine/putrescine transport system substrate-binding protein